MVNVARRSFFVIIIFFNLFILIYLAGTNRLATNDEARGISAGVSHWLEGALGWRTTLPRWPGWWP